MTDCPRWAPRCGRYHGDHGAKWHVPWQVLRAGAARPAADCHFICRVLGNSWNKMSTKKAPGAFCGKRKEEREREIGFRTNCVLNGLVYRTQPTSWTSNEV